MKRLFALFLALTLLVTVLPFQASAAQGSKLIAITFDDGPDRVDTPRLLDGLKERNVPVTFFMQGGAANYCPDLVQRAYDEGHEIASHTWDHPELTSLTDDQIRSQISKTENVLDKACGVGATYLVRPPYGSTNARVRSLIACPMIHWSVDTLDWQLLNSYAVRDAIVREAFDGAVVLLHDIHSTSVDGALMAIDTLLERGYELVTVSELFRRRGIELKGHTDYFMAKPNGYEDPGPIATPKISYTIDGGKMHITITADTDAPIYYTTDGTAPKEGAKVYTGPFTVDFPCDIRAVAAYKLNGSKSRMAMLAYGKTPCQTPEIQVENMVMTLSNPEGADMYYTLDGTPATKESTRYTGPVKLEGICTIRAVSGGGMYAMSKEVELLCSTRSNLYADMDPEAWYFDSVDRLVSTGIMSGVGNYRFNPEGKLTRAMLVALLYRASGDKLEEGWERTNTFRDVADDSWYAESVEWAYRHSIVNGYSPTVFRPNGNITRQEMCKVIDGYLIYQQTPLAPGASCEDIFSDYKTIGTWALPSVEAMTGAGLIVGMGTRMVPQGTTTRAEISAVLVRMLDYQAAYITPEEPQQ